MAIADQILIYINVFLGLAVFGVLAYFIFAGAKYKYKVRIREVINGRKIIIDDKGWLRKDIDGIAFIYLRKLKRQIPIPPHEAIDIDKKGNPVFEVYMTENGNFVPIKDNAEVQELEPLTTNQRQILVNRIKKAAERKGKKWQDYIIPIAGISALVVIVVSLLIFYEDMGKPLIEMAGKVNANQALHNENLRLTSELNFCSQTLGGGSDIVTAPSPIPTGGTNG